MFNFKKSVSKRTILGIVLAVSVIVSGVGVGCYAFAQEDEIALKPYVSTGEKVNETANKAEPSGFEEWNAAKEAAETEPSTELLSEQQTTQAKEKKDSKKAYTTSAQTVSKSVGASNSSAKSNNKVSGTASQNTNVTTTKPVETTAKNTFKSPYPIEPSLGISFSDLDIPEYTSTSGKSIKCGGGGDIKIAANTKTQSFNYRTFSNDESNPSFARYEIRLKDTNEVICSTGLVPPGYSVKNFTFDRALAPGEYRVQIYMYNYSYDYQLRTLNNCSVITTMVAE